MSAESYIKLRNFTVQEGEPVKQIIQRGVPSELLFRP
jgi:hypothetical protein